ncbi:MAG: histidine kinase [Prosthecochloris sp.]|uniref:PAS domain-containing protein n=1 Tax=Prosthecochloris sp. TaxID=290513 RepID=UPI0013CA0B43|nr:PAS domain-containing protein [Prosthecochloris sp.]NEX12814.1 histidine kinase [Prosthecochloris sp.]
MNKPPLINSSIQTLENVITVLKAGTWEWNIQTGIVTVNRFWYDMLGYEAAEPEMTMQTWQDMIHPDDLETVMSAAKMHLDGNSNVYEVEFRLKHCNGQWVWIRSNGRIMEYDGNRDPLYFCGVHIDITEKKTVQKELRAANELFRFLFSNSSDAIVLLKGAEIMDCNPRALTFFDCSDRNLIVGKSLLDLSPAKQPDGSESLVRFKTSLQKAETGKPQWFAWQCQTENKVPVECEVCLKKLTSNPEGYIVALLQDASAE